MAIKLEIQDYCSECWDFNPDVVKPEKITLHDDSAQNAVKAGTASLLTRSSSPVELIQTDTIIRCEYAKRCSNLIRYLNQYNKERVKE